jgi:hypothetical protein
MAVFEKRARTVTTHEYVMPNPVNWAEYEKALGYAHQEYMHANGGKSASDDSIWVTHPDDEIIIYWEEK